MRHVAISFAILLTIYTPHTYAAAWTQAKGSGQSIISSNLYRSTGYFDNNGKSHSSDVTFIKSEFNPFIEYGLTDNLTVGINPTLQQWRFEKTNTSTSIYDFRQCGITNTANTPLTNAYVTEAEIFLRRRVYEQGPVTLSLQPLVKTPCLVTMNGETDVLENTADYELRLLGGYAFQWEPGLDWGVFKRPFSGQYHFFNAELAYRKRPEIFSDQLRFDTTAGFRYNDKLLLLGQVFSTISTGEEPVQGVAGNTGIATIKDQFYTVKLQGSAVRQLTKKTSVQLGIFHEALGKNSGNGTGASLSLWYGF